MSYSAHPARRSPLLIGLYVKALGGALLAGALFWALGHFDMLADWGCVLLGLAAVGGCLGAPELVRVTTVYQLIDGEVRCTRGIINRRNEAIRIGNILSREVEQNIVERFVLRTGTVVFASGATNPGSDDIRFAGVSDPQRALQVLRAMQDGAAGWSMPPSEPAISGAHASAPVMPAGQTGPAAMPPMGERPPLPPR